MSHKKKKKPEHNNDGSFKKQKTWNQDEPQEYVGCFIQSMSTTGLAEQRETCQVFEVLRGMGNSLRRNTGCIVLGVSSGTRSWRILKSVAGKIGYKVNGLFS